MASLKDKRLFLLDMDGTLYLDEHLFDKVPEFLNLIRRQGGRGMSGVWEGGICSSPTTPHGAWRAILPRCADWASRPRRRIT